jgi:uncharacterized membrane protein
MVSDAPTLPDHVSESVGDLAALHTQHRQTTGRGERLLRAVTRIVGRPASFAVFLTAVVGWIAFNTAAHGQPWAVDEPPFAYLESLGTLLGVCLTILILITQQRDDALAERRDQLTLELAVISDRKSAKIIELLEELRRDIPSVSNRDDAQASEMAEADDPKDILAAIQTSHDGIPAETKKARRLPPEPSRKR